MMYRSLTRTLILAAVGAALSARADVVTDWNQIALQTIKAERANPPRASRMLAILHTAIYDSVNGITHTHTPYAVRGKAPGIASKEAAAAAAAYQVLTTMITNETLRAQFVEAYQASLAEVPAGRSRDAGVRWGMSVANTILRLRSNDGSAGAQVDSPGSSVPGLWTNTPPAFAPYLLPLWGTVRPFAMSSPAQLRPGPPPALDSEDYARELNQTKDLGSINSSNEEHKQIARFWADGAGTVTPPGHWNVIAQDVAQQLGTTLEENARLFALLNIATADAAICSWDCKYAYQLWRPVTAIRNADLDGNDFTDADPAWTPLLATPPFPEYTSGHSTFSGAASTVLAEFFGADDIAFTTTSEDLPGVSRSFNSFSEAAMEAGMSRIFGGIHFMSANLNGLESGRRIGALASAHFLNDRPGRSQRGR